MAYLEADNDGDDKFLCNRIGKKTRLNISLRPNINFLIVLKFPHPVSNDKVKG
jgi:hypothetical protein